VAIDAAAERVYLPGAIAQKIIALARESPDREVCGLLGAGPWGVTCYPVANVAAQPRCRFELDPKAQIEAMRQMRERDESLFAIYHSHPAGPPVPSATDIGEAAYRDVLYLIVCGKLRDGGLRAFRIVGGGAIEVSLEF
jgi:proteasome lid subunit RPN8/RPN11